MKCFYHPLLDAVGTCKACSKGLCRECAVDLGHSIACPGACEGEAKAVQNQIQAFRRTLSNQKRNRFFTPALAALFGTVFLAAGLLRRDPANFATVMGVAVLIAAVALLVVNTRWARDIESHDV